MDLKPNRRDLLAAAAALSASPAFAQEPTAVQVRMETGAGTLVIQVYPDKAPITAGNFLRYVDGKLYDGATFYRATRVENAPEYGLVQGGLQNEPKKTLKPIAHEPTTQTGLTHKTGAISMGRHAPGTATSDFFICIGDFSYLDADPRLPGDNLGFAAFGEVVEGLDVAREILAMPTSPTAGEGAMRGQMLAKPIPILAARRA
ncbi:MAG: peptidylprolyl isomerase [Phenylobacterium sp.]|jgi:peptidyl-prolyl cis-trans isomerase A (cyclophilin A)|uniref:peptidylprolyl isomerase n=1 Tax=Phenylobacterium sp. TaxID=1871053 RepID=UPI00391D805C